MIILFWLLIIIIFYAYWGYPLVLLLFAKINTKDIRSCEIYPLVSIIITAYNEEKNIRDKLDNTLRLAYPKEQIEIVVVSDGSTDTTDAIVREYKNRGVKLLRVKGRRGKTAAQNYAAKEAKGEILVFSDATTMYKQELLQKLIRGFSDSRVGAVGGELLYVDKAKTFVGKGNSIYWKYEQFLKKKESSITSLIGVSGCCYAIRRELYEPLPTEVISDFVIAQSVYKKGYMVRYEPEAISYEETNRYARDEFSMRVRIGVRTLYGLWRMKEMLNVFKYGFYSLQIFSHKILRYCTPLLLLFLLSVNILIVDEGLVYLYSLFLQIIFYLIAIMGFLLSKKSVIFSVPLYFCSMNFALLIAFFRFVKGDREVTWKPIRK